MNTSLSRFAAKLILASVVGMGIVGCDGDSTGPAPQGFVSIVAVFQTPGAAELTQVTKLRVVFTRDDGTVVRDTVLGVAATALADPIVLQVPMAHANATTGEDFVLRFDLLNDAGVVLFSGGPVSVFARPDLSGTSTSITAVYVGPGSAAVRVEAAAPVITANAGATVDIVVTAFDANDNVVPNAFIVWSVDNDAVASLADPTIGRLVAGGARGTTVVRASLVTGAFAEVTLVVQPPATTIAIASGNDQLVTVGTVATTAVAARVTAADGLGVLGVEVGFVVQSANGTLSAASAVTNADGLASVSFTAGTVPGSATIMATAAGLAGSPVSFTLTITPGAAVSLVFTTQPTNGTAGATLPPVVVEARDAFGNHATGFAGAVTLSLESPPAGVTLLGTVNVIAFEGAATFSAVRVSAGGTGLRLRAAAAGVAGAALSDPFTMVTAVATDLVVTSVPTTAFAGQLLRIVAEARTADGVVATEYTGALLVTIISGPAGGAIVTNDRVAFEQGVAVLEFGLSGLGTYELLLTATGLPQRVVGPVSVIAAQIVTHSGDAQLGAALATLPLPIVARVIDNAGQPIAGVEVFWDVTAGGGDITTIVQFTDGNGLASALWTLGAAGPQSATASIAGGSTAGFAATIDGLTPAVAGEQAVALALGWSHTWLMVRLGP